MLSTALLYALFQPPFPILKSTPTLAQPLPWFLLVPFSHMALCAPTQLRGLSEILWQKNKERLLHLLQILPPYQHLRGKSRTGRLARMT